jgi:D-xylose transport system ATP-binding protein
VYQDLALCDNLDVVANLFLGRERVGAVPLLLDEEAMEQKALAVLETLKVSLPSVRAPIGGLSGGQRQSVAVARAIMGEAKLVMLDEPTAALGVAQTAEVLDLILRLKERGLAVLVISHNLADVFRVADRIVVLRLGSVAGDLETRATTREQVVALITGAAVGPAASVA